MQVLSGAGSATHLTQHDRRKSPFALRGSTSKILALRAAGQAFHIPALSWPLLTLRPQAHVSFRPRRRPADTNRRSPAGKPKSMPIIVLLFWIYKMPRAGEDMTVRHLLTVSALRFLTLLQQDPQPVRSIYSEAARAVCQTTSAQHHFVTDRYVETVLKSSGDRLNFSTATAQLARLLIHNADLQSRSSSPCTARRAPSAQRKPSRSILDYAHMPVAQSWGSNDAQGTYSHAGAPIDR